MWRNYIIAPRFPTAVFIEDMGHRNSLYALFEHRWNSQGSNPQLHLTLHTGPVCTAPARGPHPHSAHWPYLQCTSIGPHPQLHLSMLALPAVHQHGAHVWYPRRWWSPHKGQDWEGVLRDSHVRPLCVVVLNHCPLVLTTLGVPLLALKESIKDTLKLEG